MIRRILHRAVDRQAATFGVPLDHLHCLAETSASAFLKLLLMGPLASHRRRLPLALLHAARLAATRTAGCEDCHRIAQWYARRDLGTSDSLTEETPAARNLRLEVEAFATKVAAGGRDPTRHAALEAQLGRAAMVEMAIVIACAGFFPAFKRALGCAGGPEGTCTLPD